MFSGLFAGTRATIQYLRQRDIKYCCPLVREKDILLSTTYCIALQVVTKFSIIIPKYVASNDLCRRITRISLQDTLLEALRTQRIMLPLFLVDMFFFVLWRCDSTRVMTSSFTRFLDHTQRRTTVGRTPLDE